MPAKPTRAWVIEVRATDDGGFEAHADEVDLFASDGIELTCKAEESAEAHAGTEHEAAKGALERLLGSEA